MLTATSAPQALQIDFHPEALEDTSVLHLKGEATFRQAPELRKQLFGALEQGHRARLVVELAEVETMDTAAMAVLVEGLMEARHGGPELYFCTPSESVRKVFALAGLEKALQRCFGCLGDLPANPSDDDCGCD